MNRVHITPAMRNLIRRRTGWIARDFIAYQRSLQTALANAYIAGMNDAVDAQERRDRDCPKGDW